MSIDHDVDDVRRCQCGCGAEVKRRFLTGHNRRGVTTSEEHRARIGESQKRAWANSRKRMPLGSRRLCPNGYWLIKVREGGRWDKEHILVMERAIGRRLVPGEQVHHINTVRTDNRLENLVLCSSTSDHQLIHGSFDALIPALMESGLVVFDHEARRYRLG